MAPVTMSLLSSICGRGTSHYTIGFLREGLWKLRLNSAWKGYSHAFSDHPSADVAAATGEYDGLPYNATVTVAPYTLLIYSQDPAPADVPQ
jgi:1,4-alpha-glucan branching enzyme